MMYITLKCVVLLTVVGCICFAEDTNGPIQQRQRRLYQARKKVAAEEQEESVVSPPLPQPVTAEISLKITSPEDDAAATLQKHEAKKDTTPELESTRVESAPAASPDSTEQVQRPNTKLRSKVSGGRRNNDEFLASLKRRRLQNRGSTTTTTEKPTHDSGPATRPGSRRRNYGTQSRKKVTTESSDNAKDVSEVPTEIRRPTHHRNPSQHTRTYSTINRSTTSETPQQSNSEEPTRTGRRFKSYQGRSRKPSREEDESETTE